MRIVDTLLFYMFFSSAVLVYGVGMLSVAEASLSRRRYFLYALKSYCCVLATVALTFLIKNSLLVPLKLNDLYPLVALLIFIPLAVFFEIIVQLTAKKTGAEFLMPYLTILLALNEGSNITDAIIISIAALTSYYLLIPILHAFNYRTGLLKNTDSFRQKLSMFLCMVIFMLALYSLNISWLNIAVWN